MAELSLGNLYEFNKNAMSQFDPMDAILFHRKVNNIADVMVRASESGQHYWMLLCHDRRDFTLFNIIAVSDGSLKPVVDEMLPTLQNRGQIIEIEQQPDGAYEIWIRDPESKENFAYYLFPYDAGVIEVND